MAEEPYDDLDIGYVEWPMPTTEEFEVVRFLNKQGVAQLWQKIKDKFVKVPTGGTTGQALVKTETGIEWGNVATDAPEIPTLPNMEGVLPVEKGGTGCTTVDGIRTMLFNFPTDEELEEYLSS